MNKKFAISWVLLGIAATACGCATAKRNLPKTVGNDTSEIEQISASLDSPQAEVYPSSHSAPPVTSASVKDLKSYDYRDMSLDEALRTAMENSTVLRELGGTVLRNPDSIRTRFSQRLQDTDPRFSREAALSAFDAQLRASAVFNNNDQTFNNSFFAGGATGFRQDLNDYDVELSKVTATGSTVAMRGVFNYDANNAPANTFRSAWNAYFEGEVRQPLLQGGGLEFNRIAGPNSVPGLYNGVLIARANADVNEIDLEIGLRDFVSNVENAYWDLYFAYRDVAARRKAMLRAREVWQERKDRKGEDEPAQLALAKEQYFRFKSDFDEAVAGRLIQGTQSRNGSTGGTLRGTGGLLVSERKLRLLIGLPVSENSLLRPGDDPTLAEIMFDWDLIRQESMNQRAELRLQQTRVRRREMELVAARNFLNPRLDAFGRYRLRGFGDNLISGGERYGTAPDSALGNLSTGDLQGWTAGVEFSVPVGFRQGHAAVANAELAVARERSVHQEQQREVVHDLGNAVADVTRAYQACKNGLNRYLSAEEALNALLAAREESTKIDFDRILDAQRRAVESEIRYFLGRAEYAVALKNVHFEKGSLLEFNNMRLADEDGNVGAQLAAPAGPADGMKMPIDGKSVPETPKAQEAKEAGEARANEMAPPPPKTTAKPKSGLVVPVPPKSAATTQPKTPMARMGSAKTKAAVARFGSGKAQAAVARTGSGKAEGIQRVSAESIFGTGKAGSK